MVKWFNNFQTNNTQKTLLKGGFFLLGMIVLSTLEYGFKYLYSIAGDVPFYRFDFHLVILAHWVLTPLAIYPYVKYKDSRIYFARKYEYAIITLKALLLTYLFSILLFIITRLIFNEGFIGLSPALVLFNGLDRTFSIGVPTTFLLIGYFYMNKNIQQKQQLDANEKAILQSKLNQLTNGFEPHFLFNNLNILSHLIDKDAEKSKAFVGNLAQLYRYLVKTNKEAIITLEQELEFAAHYLKVINVKFEDVYKCTFKVENAKDYYLIPNTLQVLIENIIKHNKVSNTKQLEFSIELTNGQLLVKNDKSKANNFDIHSSKTGLKNLKDRYKLGLDIDIKVEDLDDTFTVSVPLVKEKTILDESYHN